MTRARPLPSFRHPPVSEVALAVQFKPIKGFTTTHLGLLWNRFRSRFPQTQVHTARPPAVERLDDRGSEGRSVEIQLTDEPPAPRLWFLSADGSELIQVQRDRFVFNWRRREENYPRYEAVRGAFSEHLSIFLGFLETEGFPSPTFNQWELSYINQIEPSEEWSSHGDVGAVIPSWSHRPSDDFLPEPEDVTLRVRYRIQDDGGHHVGRMYVVAEPRFALPDRRPVILLRLTTRGPAPSEDGSVDGTIERLDLAREWIVKGFTSITSEEMHRRWGRER